MPERKPTPEELRAALFIPPETQEDLARWIRVYLGIDLPGIRVDADSNSSPMELVWELYNAARLNLPGYDQVLAYAARDSFKTFSAAVFEVLCIVLLERSVAHMAAILPQAKKSTQYLTRHMNRPFLRDYVTTKNERMMEVTRYEHKETGFNYTKDQYELLSPVEQDKCREVKHYVTIVVCTMQGANSEHVPVMVVDEVDVVENPEAYEEAKAIPAPFEGKMPMTLYTSTRKFSFGLVQKEIDNAVDTGLIIRHWNLMDVTHHCPASRHEPDKPKVPIYWSKETLRSMSEADWALLEEADRAKYQESLGYHGCLNNCRLFAMCRGKLAELPTCKKCGDKGMGCPGFPKPVEHTQNAFKKWSIDRCKAQLLCWKPSTEGLVYPNFSRERHMISAAQMAQLITGEPQASGFGKAELIALAKERGARFVAGIDHGFTHNFSVVVGFILTNRLFIIDVLSQAELELGQKVRLCLEKVKPLDPETWADPEAPGDNKTLKKDAQLRIKEWSKGKGSVADGISFVRLLMSPTLGDEPRFFLLKDDDGCNLLATRLSIYHFMKDAAGRITDEPDDEDDDECDALRYLVLNTFAPKTRASVSEVESKPTPSPLADQGVKQYHPETWMRQIISENTGISYEEDIPSGQGSGRKGSFSWDLSPVSKDTILV